MRKVRGLSGIDLGPFGQNRILGLILKSRFERLGVDSKDDFWCFGKRR